MTATRLLGLSYRVAYTTTLVSITAFRLVRPIILVKEKPLGLERSNATALPAHVKKKTQYGITNDSNSQRMKLVSLVALETLS